MVAMPSARRSTKNSTGSVSGPICWRMRACSSAGSVANSSSARGCTPMERLMMNSSRASPTPRLGRPAKSKARSGLATFSISATDSAGIDSTGMDCSSNSSAPRYTLPASPSAQDTVTSSPSMMVFVASPQPTTAGMPSSRAMMAAWQVRPPRLVTIAAERFITGSQSGSVMSATSTSPGCTRAISATERITRAGPAPMRAPMARPVAITSERAFRLKRRSAPAARLCTVSGRACRMKISPLSPSLPHSMSMGRA